MNAAWAPGVVMAVALGGAIGAVARYGLGVWLGRVAMDFPLATLLINIAGSFGIGLCFMYFHASRGWPESEPSLWREGIRIGFLGAFTTFSTFSMESLVLLQRQQYGTAAVYMAGSMAAGLLAAWSGVQTGRWCFGA